MTEKPIKEMTFEEAMRALEEIVDQLDRADLGLEKSLELHQKGTALKAHCEKTLAAAEEKVAQITTDADGQPTGTRPFEA